MVNTWTRDDLPDATELCRMSVYNIDVMVDRNLNAIVDHLNANHPKSDTDRWRRAHEIVEQERDQARDERDTWEDKWLDTYEALRDARAERDEAVARAEAAEARTAPAVSRADVAEALSRCINPEMWNVTFPSVVSEVCDLFGVEAGQAADPLLDKAQEFAALADWELTDREAELLHTVAAHVLGREVK